MPLTLLATSLKRKGFSDITSATELGEYLAHGKYITNPPSHLNFIEFADEGDAVIFQNDCTFVPPLNVPVTLKSPEEPMLLCNLQFNRVEYINSTRVKMYVDESVQGLTSIDDPDTFNGRAEWHQYLKMTSANFDHDRPFWKDRNTKKSEFLESQRERKHICTLTNEERINFTWNADLETRFNPSQHSSDRLPDQTNGWTVFRGWKLLDGEDLSEVNQLTGNQDLVIAEGGIYELHFNIFFYAQAFEYGDGESAFSGTFETRAELTQAVSLYLSTNDDDRNTAAVYYGTIDTWLFDSGLTSFNGLFEDYTLLSDSALTEISLNWDVSNITDFTDMFKGNHKYGIGAVLAINSAWGTSNPTNWSQTNAQLKTAPFETRDQVMAAISGYPTSSAVYGTIDTWLFDSGLTSFNGLFEDYTLLSDSALTEISLNWDVSNITDFTDMFKGNHKYGIGAVLAINSAWGTSNPTNWSQTNAQLKTAPFETRAQLMAAISGLPNGAAQPYPTSAAVYGTIDTWLFDPGLTSFRSIFSAKDISTWPSISNWDVQNVTDMKSMFEGASGLDQHAITGWDVANVEDMSSMFRNCTSFDQNITSWDVSMVEDMSSMFEGCTDIPDGLRQNIQNWTVGNVDYFNDMFKNSGRWPVDTVLAINAAWGTSNPTTQSIAQLLTAPFETPNQVIVAIDLWYTSPATYADTYGNMSSWDFASTLTDFSGLFFRNGAELTTFNEDISGWDVSNVTNMSKMFKGCSSFNRNLASWGQKVGNVTDMTSMFEDCTSMDVTNQESLKHWNVSSVGVTAVNNSELWSVDYCFDSSGYTTLVSGDDNGNSYNPAGVYVTLTGQVGVWNRTKGMVYAWTSPTAVGTNAKYDISGLDSCLDDGGVVYKAKTNVDFVWNITNKNHQAFSPEGHHQYFNSGLDRFQKTNAGYEVTSIRSISFPGPMLGEFRNLPPGAYTMRIFGQTHSEISVPTHISDTGLTSVVNIGQFSAGGQSPASPTATQAYVDFTGLSPEATLYSSSDAIGFSMQPKAGQVVHSMGGVQLKREFEVSRFKDMFKNSSWTTASASVVSQIDAAWGNTTTTNPDTNLIHGNANWWKNEAKLSE